MVVENRLEHWKAKAFCCPKCGNKTFYVDVEEKILPTGYELLISKTGKRVAFICCKCGKRWLPEDALNPPKPKKKKKRRKKKDEQPVCTGGICHVSR